MWCFGGTGPLAGAPGADAPVPQAVLAIGSRLPLEAQLMSSYIDEALVVMGTSLRDLDSREGALVTLIMRGNRLIPPRGRRWCRRRGTTSMCWRSRRIRG